MSTGPALHAHEITPDDAAFLRMMAGARFGPDTTVILPSGKAITGAEMQRWLDAGAKERTAMSGWRYKSRQVDKGFDVIDTADGNAILANMPQDRLYDVVEALNAAYERGHEDGFEEAAQR